MISRYCDATDYLDLLKKVMTDGGYTGEKFAEAVKSLCGAEVEVVKRNLIRRTADAKPSPASRERVNSHCFSSH